MSNPKLAIVIGSVRPNRFAAHAAEWIEQIARQRGDFDVELGRERRRSFAPPAAIISMVTTQRWLNAFSTAFVNAPAFNDLNAMGRNEGPGSAALRYHLIASASFRSPPWPLSYMTPRWNCASASPCSASGCHSLSAVA